MDTLKENIKDAVLCYFDADNIPKIINGSLNLSDKKIFK